MERVLVTGANGFIGRALVEELLKQEYAVTAFDCTPVTDPLFSHPKCIAIQGDLLQQESISRAVRGCSAVIHLASVLGNPDYQKNYQVHVTGTRNLLAACSSGKIKRILAYSTVAATREKSGAYGSTKKEMEQLLLSPEAKGIAVTIFRPTMVFGYGGKGISTIVNLVRAYPFVIPLVGSGKAKRQPIFLKDLIQLTIIALQKKSTEGKIYALGGPETISFRELVDRVKQELQVKKMVLPLPKYGVLSLALLLEKISSKPAFTTENVRNATLDESAEVQAIYQDCSFQATPLQKVLSEVLQQYKREQDVKKR